MEDQNQNIVPEENQPEESDAPSEQDEHRKEEKAEEKKEEKLPAGLSDSVSLPRKRIFRLALAVAILNPVFSGFILAAAFLSEPSLRREGKIIAAAAIISAAIQVYALMERAPRSL